VNIPGCAPGARVRRPAQGSFVVNLGEIFDLVNIKAPATEFPPTPKGRPGRPGQDKNVTSIALEVPRTA
jgi:hypothetical protein